MNRDPQDHQETHLPAHSGKLRKSRLRRGIFLFAALLSPLALLFAVSAAYERSQGGACASCHEIWAPYSDWQSSSHRHVPCADCHGDVFTLDAGFHINNLRRIFTHLRGKAPPKPRLRNKEILQVMLRCQKCHQQEFADWRSSRHSVTYADLFLNTAHNQRQLLMDDCLRCHGMHFEGGIRDLVSPVSTTGPWRMNSPELAAQPAIPCLTCHQIHHQGAPLGKSRPGESLPGGQQEIYRPSLALFDRRELDHVPVGELPLPKLFDGAREVHLSPDQRQALCYQCHAPLATRQVRSGDDRTPIGVHEGLSCLACHLKHGQQTRPSCGTCHPRLSNCGLAVLTMDTTYKDPRSRHNIHFVKCIDCHTHGIPKKTASAHLAAITPSRRH
ncbi:MAG: multiheme c-type cytochrome [Candidatus Acidiferrum sp.]